MAGDPPMFSPPEMTSTEREYSRLFKVTCLMVIAAGVIYVGMDRLQGILIPFLLALAMTYLLKPLIDLLSCSNVDSCTWKLSRGWAVFFSIIIAALVLVLVSMIMWSAIEAFMQRSSQYRERMEQLLEQVFLMGDKLADLLFPGADTSSVQEAKEDGAEEPALAEASRIVSNFLQEVSITDEIMHLLGTVAELVENVMYILLFLIFMLVPHNDGEHAATPHPVAEQVERQIFKYIGGKATISGYVAASHGLVLWLCGLQGLWLSFGVLTFFLNFIPNVGGLGAVLLPMPLFVLDPAFGFWSSILAFAIPFVNTIFAKDVLEPKLMGEATGLKPVVVMLSILLFGSVWGITGMVRLSPARTVVFSSSRCPCAHHSEPPCLFPNAAGDGYPTHCCASDRPVVDESPAAAVLFASPLRWVGASLRRGESCLAMNLKEREEKRMTRMEGMGNGIGR